MKFFNELVLIESDLSSKKEAQHVINTVNSLYTEWKKIGRRKNAVDIITTTANKLSTIDPTILPYVHDATKIKLVALIVRCFDIPYWKDLSQKEKIYKKLINLVKKLENEPSNIETNGSLREVIMTRLSAAVSYTSENKTVFVVYEPKVTNSYLRYLFGKEVPTNIIRMQSLSLPGDFESLIKIINIDHEKAVVSINGPKKK